MTLPEDTRCHGRIQIHRYPPSHETCPRRRTCQRWQRRHQLGQHTTIAAHLCRPGRDAWLPDTPPPDAGGHHDP